MIYCLEVPPYWYITGSKLFCTPMPTCCLTKHSDIVTLCKEDDQAQQHLSGDVQSCGFKLLYTRYFKKKRDPGKSTKRSPHQTISRTIIKEVHVMSPWYSRNPTLTHPTLGAPKTWSLFTTKSSFCRVSPTPIAMSAHGVSLVFTLWKKSLNQYIINVEVVLHSANKFVGSKPNGLNKSGRLSKYCSSGSNLRFHPWPRTMALHPKGLAWARRGHSWKAETRVRWARYGEIMGTLCGWVSFSTNEKYKSSPKT